MPVATYMVSGPDAAIGLLDARRATTQTPTPSLISGGTA